MLCDAPGRPFLVGLGFDAFIQPVEMRAEQESETFSASNTSQSNGSTLQLPTTAVPSRKRKRAPAVTASPAPSDQSSTNVQTINGENSIEYVCFV